MPWIDLFGSGLSGLGNMRALSACETSWYRELVCPEGIEPPTLSLEG